MRPDAVPAPAPNGFQPIAVIGLAVLLPGADSAAGLHRLLSEGHDGVRAVPPERLTLAGLDQSADYSVMGVLDGIEEFDHDFFGITPAEAEVMDPHQRLTLQLACAAIENAGYRLSALRGERTGVFVSTPRPDFHRLVGDSDLLTLLGTAPAAIAGRISYLLGLEGAAMSFDAGCCSSLVALHQACLELACGTVDTALAGGFNLQLFPLRHAEAAAFPEVMAASGRTRAFDAAAEGTCQGEGGALLLLKPLERAVADGDHIHAVVRGTAVNHNGARSSGFTAPGLTAQVEVITQAWQRSCDDPRRMAALEAHGSGTRLGDMIELAAVQRVLRAAGAPAKATAISSIKTNFGHLDHAAGAAALAKAVLAARHRVLYRSLNFAIPNEQLTNPDSPVYINTLNRQWDGPAAEAMLTGVSSFSLTGTNAHVVIESPPRAEAPAQAARPDLATVSAKSAPLLARYLSALKEWLPALAEDDLASALFVLNAGRDDWPYRVAFPVHDLQSLARGLQEATARPLSTGAGATPVARRLALVIGAESGAADESAELRSSYPAYRAAWSACADAPGAVRDQYATAMLLRSAGITPGVVLGVGPGRAVAAAVRGELNADRIGAEQAATPARTQEEQQKRADAVIARLNSEMPTAWCVMGDARSLFAGAATDRHTLLAWQALTTEDFLTGVAALYESGVTINWDAWYRDGQRSRIELPTYPFAKTRCWPPIATATAPPTAPAATSGQPMPPSTEDAEQEIAGIWESVLKVGGLKPESDYFELGGNSVLALAVVDRINRRFGSRLTLPTLYENSTVSALAATIHQHSGTGAAEKITRIPRQQPFLPSHGQESLWFLEQYLPGTPVYNVPVDIHLVGSLDVAAMRTALANLERRHEVLRSRFVEVNGSPRIMLRPADERELEVLDLSGVPDETARMEQAVQRLHEAATQPMDLAAGPLYRKFLVTLAADDHILLLVAHHTVYDGWSPTILDRDLWEFYAAAVQGRPAVLPELPISYLDYAAWQQNWLSGETRDQLLRFWRHQLAGITPLSLPASRPRPRQLSGRGGHYRFTIPADTVAGLRLVAATERCTLFVTILTAVKILLARVCGQSDIVVGTTTAGRSRPETLDLLGYFNNAVPLRTRLAGDLPFRTAMARVRSTVVEALKHDELPFAMLVADLEPGRDLSRQPLFQVSYVHQNLPENARDIAPSLDYRLDREEIFAGLPPGTAKWDLSFSVWEFDGRASIPGVVEYSVDLFDAAQAQWLGEAFLALLSGIAANPGSSILRLPVPPVPTWSTAGVVSVAADETLPKGQASGEPDDVEVSLIGIWKDVLGIKAADSNTNFFHHGGHSMLVMNVMSEIRKRYGSRPPVSRFFENPTPAAFAAEIRGMRKARAAGPADQRAAPPRRAGQGIGAAPHPGGSGVALRPLRVPADAVTALRRLAGDGQATAGLLTSIAMLHASRTGAAEVTVGVRTPQAGTHVPIRMSFEADPEFGAAVRRAAAALGRLPGRRAQPADAQHPPFAVGFEMAAPGTAAAYERALQTPGGRLDAVWQFGVSDEPEIRGTFVADAAGTHPRAAKQLVGQWRRLLLDAVAEPSRTFSMLSASVSHDGGEG